MGPLNLPESGPIYLDACGFIYSAERIEPSRTLMEPVRRRASTGQISVVTGELAVIQTIVKPLRDGDETVQELCRDLLNSRDVRLAAPMHTLWESAAP